MTVRAVQQAGSDNLARVYKNKSISKSLTDRNMRMIGCLPNVKNDAFDCPARFAIWQRICLGSAMIEE